MSCAVSLYVNSVVRSATMPSVPESDTTEPLTGAAHGGLKERGDNTVKLKKELGLLEGVAIILGIIIGSGECSCGHSDRVR